MKSSTRFLCLVAFISLIDNQTDAVPIDDSLEENEVPPVLNKNEATTPPIDTLHNSLKEGSGKGEGGEEESGKAEGGKGDEGSVEDKSGKGEGGEEDSEMGEDESGKGKGGKGEEESGKGEGGKGDEGSGDEESGKGEGGKGEEGSGKGEGGKGEEDSEKGEGGEKEGGKGEEGNGDAVTIKLTTSGDEHKQTEPTEDNEKDATPVVGNDIAKDLDFDSIIPDGGDSGNGYGFVTLFLFMSGICCTLYVAYFYRRKLFAKFRSSNYVHYQPLRTMQSKAAS